MADDSIDYYLWVALVAYCMYIYKFIRGNVAWKLLLSNIIMSSVGKKWVYWNDGCPW